MRWLIVIFLSLFLAGGVQAQNVKAQEEKRARLEREIEILDKQLSENASKSSSMLSNLTLIRKKVANRKALVSESDKKVREYSDKIYLKQRSINRMQARIDTLSTPAASSTTSPLSATYSSISDSTLSLSICIPEKANLRHSAGTISGDTT